MVKSKAKLITIAVLITLPFLLSGGSVASGSQSKLAQAVYITRSQACGCSAEQVKVADKVVSQVFSGSRQALLKRIDYDTDRQAAVPYIGEFRLIQLPALLLLDSQGHLLWSAIGDLDLNKLEAKMKGLGA